MSSPSLPPQLRRTKAGELSLNASFAFALFRVAFGNLLIPYCRTGEWVEQHGSAEPIAWTDYESLASNHP